MNNKWIVPIVAILLCAVSLIGAGYAAYSATLTDTETVDVNNNYMELRLGEGEDITRQVDLDLEYAEVANYAQGAFKNVKYTLDTETKTAIVYFKVFNVNNTPTEGITDMTKYTLAINDVAFKNSGSTVVLPSGATAASCISVYAVDSDDKPTGDPITGQLTLETKYAIAITLGAEVYSYASSTDDALYRSGAPGATTYATASAAIAAFEAEIPTTVVFTMTATAVVASA